MSRFYDFVVVLGSQTPVCLGPVQNTPPTVRIARASFPNWQFSGNLWTIASPRVVSSEGWCNIGHRVPGSMIADFCMDVAFPVNGTMTLEVDGEQFACIVSVQTA